MFIEFVCATTVFFFYPVGHHISEDVCHLDHTVEKHHNYGFDSVVENKGVWRCNKCAWCGRMLCPSGLIKPDNGHIFNHTKSERCHCKGHHANKFYSSRLCVLYHGGKDCCQPCKKCGEILK